MLDPAASQHQLALRSLSWLLLSCPCVSPKEGTAHRRLLCCTGYCVALGGRPAFSSMPEVPNRLRNTFNTSSVDTPCAATTHIVHGVGCMAISLHGQSPCEGTARGVSPSSHMATPPTGTSPGGPPSLGCIDGTGTRRKLFAATAACGTAHSETPGHTSCRAGNRSW